MRKRAHRTVGEYLVEVEMREPQNLCLDIRPEHSWSKISALKVSSILTHRFRKSSQPSAVCGACMKSIDEDPLTGESDDPGMAWDAVAVQAIGSEENLGLTGR